VTLVIAKYMQHTSAMKKIWKQPFRWAVKTVPCSGGEYKPI